MLARPAVILALRQSTPLLPLPGPVATPLQCGCTDVPVGCYGMHVDVGQEKATHKRTRPGLWSDSEHGGTGYPKRLRTVTPMSTPGLPWSLGLAR